MSKKLLSFAVLAAIVTAVLCSNPSNPFTNPDNAKITLFLMNSSSRPDTLRSVTDTVGNTVRIGVCPSLYSYIDSVSIVVSDSQGGIDTQIVLKNFTSDLDTQWVSKRFGKIGAFNVSAWGDIRGGKTSLKLTGEITIVGKPIRISTQPVGASKNQDSSLTLSVQVAGAGPYTYQWYHDSTAISSNGTLPALFIKPLSLSDSGKYTCVVKDQWDDSVTTDTAKIIVIPRPIPNRKPLLSINGHPNILSTDICSLTVSATDPDTGEALTFGLIKSPSGSAFGNGLFVWAPPASYLGSAMMRTDTAIFTVIDNGMPPLSDTQKVYIVVSAKILPPDSLRGIAPMSRFNGSFVFGWQKSANADLYVIYRSKDTAGFTQCGTTTDTTFTNYIKDTAFYYYVVATNSKGSSAASKTIRSTSINAAPKWLHDIISMTINEGASFSLNLADSVRDTNGDAITLLMQNAGSVNDSLIATTWKYAPSYTDSGSHVIKIKAWDGMDSSIVTLAVKVVNVPRPPQPQPQSLSTKMNTALTITLSAIDPDNDAITGWVIDTPTTHGTASAITVNAGAASLTYTPTNFFIGTDYFTFKALSGTLTSTYSAKVAIKVDTNNILPQITQKLSAKTLKQGDTLTLTVTVNSNAFPAPLYSWYKAGTFLDSTWINYWKKANAQGTDSGFYYVIVSNVAGRDSSGAFMTVNVPPAIFTQPVAAQTVTAPAPDTFKVVATGNPDPTYQWMKNNNPITGATSATYVIAASAGSDSGSYAVVVTNSQGSVTSNTAKLTVNVPPSIVTQPVAAQTVIAPAPDTFKVVASGNPALTYQWKKNGNPITGATSASYIISATVVADAGSYTVAVTNTVGSVASNASVLTVNAAPILTPFSPAIDTVNQGSPIILTAQTANAPSPAPSFKWFKNKVFTQVKSASNPYAVNAAAAYSDSGLYTVVDSNSIGKDTASMLVIIKDTTHPVVSLNGAADTTILLGTTWTDPVTASDPYDGAITGITKAPPVVTSAPGKFTVRYKVFDKWGNGDSSKTRIVRVEGWVAAPDVDALDFSAAQAGNGDLYFGYEEPLASSAVVSKLDSATNTWINIGGGAAASVGQGIVIRMSWDKTTPYISVQDPSCVLIRKYSGGSWIDAASCGDSAIPSGISNLSSFKAFSDGAPYIIGRAYSPRYLQFPKFRKFDGIHWTTVYGSDTITESGSQYQLEMAASGMAYVAYVSNSNAICVQSNQGSGWSYFCGRSVPSSWEKCYGLVIDESPVPVPYVMGNDSVDGISPVVWKPAAEGWFSLSHVKNGSVTSANLAYSSTTKNVYGAYIDGDAGKIDSCYIKEYSGGVWQGFPKLTKGIVPVTNSRGGKLFVLIGANRYYLVYPKGTSQVGVLVYNKQ